MSGLIACPECGSTHVEEGLDGSFDCMDCDSVFEEEEADIVDDEEDEDGDGLREEDYY